ncbi:MAG: glycosyltransferase family 2 protein [Myxococcota bacterium]
MYKERRILVTAPAWNEEKKIGKVVERIPKDIADHILVVDDGSTDNTAQVARDAGAEVLSLHAVLGVGYALREAFKFGQREKFDIIVILAGNNKDSPEEIPRLLEPICENDIDFVMGSRFLAGGQYGGDMPLYRKLATRIHPLCVSALTRQWVTESTNGFRAMKLSVLDNPQINLNQSWLDHYELEVYLLMRILQLNYRTAEVPCTKIYPNSKIGNTKMRPLVDWWKMLRPIFLVGLGLRK